MLNKILIMFIAVFFALSGAAFATFDMTIDPAAQMTIDFGGMKLGQERVLEDRGGYEHKFNFVSDTGRPWYFKAFLVRPFTSGTDRIPPENFQWIIEQLKNGQGILSTNISNPIPFTTVPGLIYSSSGSDSTGTEVQIRLKYKLTIPKAQRAGAYTAQIRFIMVEAL